MSDLSVLTVVCCNQDYCSKSAPKIGQLSRVGTRTVFRSLEKLESLGLVQIEKVTKRTWRIWPLIARVTATQAASENRHTAKLHGHTAKSYCDILPHRQANSNLTLTKHSDLKIDEETTRDQMQKLGLNLNLKEIAK